MKEILSYLFDYKTLSRQQACEALKNISKGLYSDTEVASFVTVFLMRSITIDEMQGFRDALLELCVPVVLDGYNPVDIVGTGGDGKNTFNISTLSCFIVAGAGYKVAKHGNYGATSVSGASNVMQYHGYHFSNDSAKLRKELEDANVCFLHAPLFHPALKTVAPVRRNLGIRTFFNLMGPLVNPCQATSRMIGVYNLEVARLYRYVLDEDTSQFTIVHSLDGYDEISLTADTRVITKAGEKTFDAVYLGKRTAIPSDIYGGNSVEEAGKLFYKILNRQGTWAQNAVVLANSAMALKTMTGKDYETCYEMSVESFESGNAMGKFKHLMEIQ